MRSLPLLAIVTFATLCALYETAHSAWPANGVAATNAVRDQNNMVLVPDGSGGLICTWADFRTGLTNSGGSPVSDVYAQRIAWNGTVLWTTDGVLVCADTLQQALPRLCSDGAGGAIIAWQDFRSADAGGTSLDVYAQRVGANGTPLWTPGGILVYGGTATQAGPKVLSDGAGGAFIVWQDDRNGGALPTDLYAQRLDASGTKLWGPSGIALCTAASTQSITDLMADGTGGFMAVWQDARSTNYDVYAQRMSGVGSALWTANGVPVCTAANNQLEPYLVTDGSGGAIITWQDGRISSVNQDVYVQRLNSTGTPLWTADGVVLCDDPGQLFNLRIAADGAGGAVTVWRDERTAFEIFARRVDGSGTPQWADDGIKIGTSASTVQPRICSAAGAGSSSAGGRTM
jgi:hypothetical protein